MTQVEVFLRDIYKKITSLYEIFSSGTSVIGQVSIDQTTPGTTDSVTVKASAGIGSLTETAPATDTASSGLNGRLQRIAQNITSFIALIPTIWNSGTSQFRSLTVNSTAQAIKASSGKLYGWNIINRDAVAIYVKIYNIAAASVNPASDVPVRTLIVPANGAIVELNTIPWNVNSTAIAIRAVTEATDTGTTAPATLPIIEILYS